MRGPLVEFEREVYDGVVLVVLEGEEFGVDGLDRLAVPGIAGGVEEVAEVVVGELGVMDGDGGGVGKPRAEVVSEASVVVHDGVADGRVVRGGAECGGGSVEGDCPGLNGGAKGAEAESHELGDICDEGGGRPIVRGGCEFGDLFVKG